MFNFLCYVSALSETTVTLQTIFNHPKVTATRKWRPLLPVKSESNGGLYFRNSTVFLRALMDVNFKFRTQLRTRT